jgi:hypothetical protein
LLTSAFSQQKHLLEVLVFEALHFKINNLNNVIHDLVMNGKTIGVVWFKNKVGNQLLMHISYTKPLYLQLMAIASQACSEDA